VLEPRDDALIRFLPAAAPTPPEITAIAEAAPVERILTHIGEPAQPPPIAPARGPPAWNDGLADAIPDWHALAQPEPEYFFDQQVQW
jgi:hypothetical protein